MDQIASHILQKCGGPQVVAAWLGVNAATVYRWTYPVEKGGTGGLIPSKQQTALLIAARKHGVVLNPDDFFFSEAIKPAKSFPRASRVHPPA